MEEGSRTNKMNEQKKSEGKEGEREAEARAGAPRALARTNFTDREQSGHRGCVGGHGAPRHAPLRARCAPRRRYSQPWPLPLSERGIPARSLAVVLRRGKRASSARGAQGETGRERRRHGRRPAEEGREELQEEECSEDGAQGEVTQQGRRTLTRRAKQGQQRASPQPGDAGK